MILINMLIAYASGSTSWITNYGMLYHYLAKIHRMTLVILVRNKGTYCRHFPHIVIVIVTVIIICCCCSLSSSRPKTSPFLYYNIHTQRRSSPANSPPSHKPKLLFNYPKPSKTGDYSSMRRKGVKAHQIPSYLALPYILTLFLSTVISPYPAYSDIQGPSRTGSYQ
jgi:hypothetical protein